MRRAAASWLPWIAGLVLLAGVASYAATRLLRPYPVAQATVSYSVKESHPGSALLELAFVPQTSSSAQPGSYTIGLKRIDGRWRVASYASASKLGPGSG